MGSVAEYFLSLLSIDSPITITKELNGLLVVRSKQQIGEEELVGTELPFCSFQCNPEEYRACACCLQPVGDIRDHMYQLVGSTCAEKERRELFDCLDSTLLPISPSLLDSYSNQFPKITNTIIECREKCGVVYCSSECEEKAWKHHTVICRLSSTNTKVWREFNRLCLDEPGGEVIFCAFQMLCYEIQRLERNERSQRAASFLTHAPWVTELNEKQKKQELCSDTCGDDCDDCDEENYFEILTSSYELLLSLLEPILSIIDLAFTFDMWNSITGCMQASLLPMAAPSPVEEILIRLKDNASSDIDNITSIIDQLLNIIGDPYDLPIEGYGYFEIAQLIPHSCAPNAFLQHREEDTSGSVIILANQVINKGEKISISRLPHDAGEVPFEFLSVDERHNLLGYTCSCERCEEELKRDHHWHFEMLHDTQRNSSYAIAIRNAIKRFKSSSNQPLHVLDIGSGSGLLSLIAAEAGADKVTTIELVPYIATLAKRIIEANGLADKIQVISGKSSELHKNTLRNHFEEYPPQLIVAELMNFSLLGEEILPTLHHAKMEIGAPDCLFVPHSARIHAQFIYCPFLGGMTGHCAESPFAVSPYEPIHLECLADCEFLSEPFRALEIFFNEGSLKGESVQDVIMSRSSLVSAIAFWWDATLDGDDIKNTTIDCSPGHKGHWSQSLYFLPHTLEVTKGETISVVSSFDQTEISFGISTCTTNPIVEGISLSHVRQGMIGNENYWAHHAAGLTTILKEHKKKSVSVTWIDGGSSRLYNTIMRVSRDVNEPFSSVCGVEFNQSLADFLKIQTGVPVLSCSNSESYNVDEKLFMKICEEHEKIRGNAGSGSPPSHFLVAEPFFVSMMDSHVVSHAIVFWWIAKRFTQFCLERSLVAPIISPSSVSLRGALIYLPDRSGLVTESVEGFDISIFNDIHQQSSRAIPIWQKDVIVLSSEFSFLSLEFGASESTLHTTNIPLSELVLHPGPPCNAVVVWVEYHFGKAAPLRTLPHNITTPSHHVPLVIFTTPSILSCSTILNISFDLSTTNISATLT